MITSLPSSMAELYALLDEMLDEEKSFCLQDGRIEPGTRAFELKHCCLAPGCEPDCPDKHIRLAHEKLFREHRRLRKEHEIVLQRVRAVANGFRERQFNDEELDLLVQRFRSLSLRMRSDHARMSKNRDRLRSEHIRLHLTPNEDA
ncbi:MAG: hypothetical protein ACE5FH_07695 [Candidatus Zixiibacteriota bacterium]